MNPFSDMLMSMLTLLIEMFLGCVGFVGEASCRSVPVGDTVSQAGDAGRTLSDQ
jgi:hypothetical protein